MIKTKSLSDKRLIVKGTINGKSYNFLLDTGATVSLIDKSIKGLSRGRIYNGTLIGAGGGLETSYICNNFAEINDRKFTQFIMCDIDNVIDSIKRQTGISIAGIIGLPQMKANNMQIDFNDNDIIFE